MSEEITLGKVMWDLFLAFWSILDVMFSWIDLQFRLVFNAIPYTAIAFLIGIICYSFLAFIYWWIDKVGQSRKRVFIKIFYVFYILFMVLFSLWRFGFIAIIDDRVSVFTIAEFCFNMFYIIFGILLIWAFYKKIPWLKKAIICILWIGFSLFTFVVGPIAGEIVLSFDTLTQFLIVGVIFLIPNTMYEYRRIKRKAI